MDTVKFVLGHFNSEEKAKMEEMYEKAADAALYIVDKGAEEAMNKFNAKGTKQ